MFLLCLRRTPYNQRSLCGYAFTWMINTFTALWVTTIMLVIDCAYFGICWYVEAIIDDLLSMMRQLDLLLGSNCPENMEAAFKEIIVYHQTIIRWMNHMGLLSAASFFIQTPSSWFIQISRWFGRFPRRNYILYVFLGFAVDLLLLLPVAKCEHPLGSI